MTFNVKDRTPKIKRVSVFVNLARSGRRRRLGRPARVPVVAADAHGLRPGRGQRGRAPGCTRGPLCRRADVGHRGGAEGEGRAAALRPSAGGHPVVGIRGPDGLERVSGRLSWLLGGEEAGEGCCPSCPFRRHAH